MNYSIVGQDVCFCYVYTPNLYAFNRLIDRKFFSFKCLDACQIYYIFFHQ